MNLELISIHVDRVEQWLNSLPENAGKFDIVFHGDCDGVISAALFDHILRRGFDVTDINHIPVRTERYDFEDALARLSKRKPDVTIILDLSIQNHTDKLRRVCEATKSRVLVYDHHRQFNDAVPDAVLYLNPGVIEGRYQNDSPPPCLFAAELAAKILDRDFTWAACIGLIAESLVDQSIGTFRKLPQRHPSLFRSDSVRSPDDVFKSGFRQISYAIGSAFWAQPGSYEMFAFDLLSKMIQRNSPESFFSPGNPAAKKIMQLEKQVRSEINSVFKYADSYCHTVPDLPLKYAEIESRYRIGGVVATSLARKYDKFIIITGQSYDGRYVIEARRGAGLKVDMAALLAEAVHQLHPLSVGGHPPAAGATLPLESSARFFLALESALRGSNIPH